jgi:hypothetical protein
MLVSVGQRLYCEFASFKGFINLKDQLSSEFLDDTLILKAQLTNYTSTTSFDALVVTSNTYSYLLSFSVIQTNQVQIKIK